MTDISTILKKLMDYYGVDQAGLAERLNVNPSQISRWLNGKSVPRGEEWMRLKEKYDEVKDEEPPLLKNLA